MTPLYRLLFPLFLVSSLIVPPDPAAGSNRGETDEETAPAAASDVPEAQPSPLPPTEGESSTPEPIDGTREEDSAGSEGARPDETAAQPSTPPDAEGVPERPDLPALEEDGALELVREPAESMKTSAPPSNVTAATLELLRRLETQHASVVTVRGDFDQLKVSEIFLEEIQSKGTFWYRKPDQFRCDYQPPDEMTNLILKESVYVYVPEIEQCEVYHFTSEQERNQQLHSMVLGFGFETDELLESYAIQSSEEEGPLRREIIEGGGLPADLALLRLTPLPGYGDTSPFTHLKLWIDKGTWLPEKVWFEDYNGDKTTLDIRSIDLNTSIDPKLFVPSFPEGTEYIDKSAS